MGSPLQVPYFLDYKMHFPSQNWEENGGASYSLNVAYLTHRAGWGAAVEQGFSSYFPPLKSRCILWSGASYIPKNTVIICFPLAAFKILSFSLTFGILIMTCLGVILFTTVLFGTFVLPGLVYLFS